MVKKVKVDVLENIKKYILSNYFGSLQLNRPLQKYIKTHEYYILNIIY